MFGRTTIRVRIVALPLLPAMVLGVIVGFDLHRSPATIIAAIVATVVGVSAALVVARSIARPLKDLATIVLDLNDLRSIDGSGRPRDDVLPPRKLRVGGELGELAVAIADGRRHAADFVQEQLSSRRSVTDLVANIALRNERLLGAALDALGEIGRRDHEPSTAAAIARVHRIVARVDRTTASALVLIGEGGRVATSASSVTDVVWASALAIESSDRVDALALSEAMIHADAVADVAHMLAELIDNAVQASSAPGRVTIMGEAAAGGDYELTIMDSGAGMHPHDLDTANRRVRRLESLHRVPVRNLGLDVVGRLARRHGVQARLGHSAAGGIVVRVLLPAAILTAPAVAPRYVPSFAVAATPATEAEPTTTPAADKVVAQAQPMEPSSVISLAESDIDLLEPEVETLRQPALVTAPEQVGAVIQPIRLADAADADAQRAAFASMPRSVSARLGAADEFLPKRDQRKWAAAISRARG